MNSNERINREAKGITLIALVITIVILIILATITIQAAFGEDGLIKRAIQAKNLTEQATKEEAEALNSLLEEYDSIIGGGETTPSDNTAPQVLISFDNTTMTTEESITATVTMSDSDSGVNVTGSKWVLSTSSGYIGTEDGSYTNSFTTNPEEIKITATTAGEYYVHILAKDNAGNTIEFVSSKITVEDAPKSEVEEAIKDGHTFDETTQITDEQENKVTIPEGFKIAEDSGKTVQQGIVIEDVSASPNKNVQGSQFVWIPVGKFKKDDGTMSNEIVLGRYTFSTYSFTGGAKSEVKLRQAAYTDSEPENYKKEQLIPFIEGFEYGATEMKDYQPGTINNSNHLNDLNATAYDLASWVNSVKNNGGYYIGRYEASFAGGSSYSIGTNGYKSASKKTNDFNINDTVSQYNIGTLYNAINQLNASKVAINTYNDSNSVKSDLMNSYAWDTALVFIQEAGNTDYANKEFSGRNISNTGKNGDEVCKINDMGCNLSEWTTETTYNPSDNGNYVCTTRGYPAGDRGYSYAHEMYDNFSEWGFRITLYIK